MTTLLDGFDGRKDMITQFECDEDDARQIMDAACVVGFYEREDYEGYSKVLLVDATGVIMENEAAHCSCYGLEGQWKPGAVNVEYLRSQQTNKHSWMSNQQHIGQVEIVINCALRLRAEMEARDGLAL